MRSSSATSTQRQRSLGNLSQRETSPPAIPAYLDADHDATVLDELGEVSAVVGALVQGFVEEDYASDAAVDALVGREEQLAVAAPVLLCVLHPNGVQPLGHAACGGTSE